MGMSTNLETVIKMFGILSIFFMKLTSDLFPFFRGDTTNTNLQNMEPVSETDQEQAPEDLGKLTEADKARTGRVSLNITEIRQHKNSASEPSRFILDHCFDLSSSYCGSL